MCWKDLPELTYNPIHYDMDPKHLKLYNKLVDEEMAKHPDGSMIDLTGAQALYQPCSKCPATLNTSVGARPQAPSWIWWTVCWTSLVAGNW